MITETLINISFKGVQDDFFDLEHILNNLEPQGFNIKYTDRSDILKAKEYLRQVKYLNNIVQSKLDQIETLRSLAQQITYVPKNIKVQESIPEDKFSQLIAKIVDLENDIKTDIDYLLDLKLKINKQINSLDNDDYKLLLMLRYLNFKTWEEIAVEMGCSYQWVHVLHSRALVYFQEKVQFSETLDSN